IEPELLLEIIGEEWKKRTDFLCDVVVGIEMHTGVSEHLRVGGLALGIAHQRQNAHRPILILSAPRRDPAALLEAATVPLHCERRFVANEVVEAAIPASCQHDLLVDKQLRRLLSRGPPDVYVL